MALNIPFRNAYYRFASSYSFLFFYFLVAVVVVIRYLAERTSRVDRDGIRYTLFGQPVYQHSIYDVLRHRSG